MRVAERDEIVAYANALLEVERWPEFAPAGLQVVGADDVTLLVCGVSSSRTLFEQAADLGADMVLVHHGLFWRNEPLVVDRRQRGRLEALFNANASLLAYHLALDAHPTLGNAAQLAARIGASPEGPFGSVGLACTLDGLSIAALTERVTEAVDREPLVFAFGPDRIERLAVSTGAAGYDLIRAAHEGEAPCLPGAMSPTEILNATLAGADLVKVFPAGQFGPSYFRDILAPMPHLKLTPTGGVDLTTAGEWIAAGAVTLGVGSALVNRKALAEGNLAEIQRLAGEFVRIVAEARAAKVR